MKRKTSDIPEAAPVIELSKPKIVLGEPRSQFPLVLQNKGYGIGVEVGTQRGEYAELILSMWPGSLFVVDPWEEQPKAIYEDVGNVDQAHHDQFMLETKTRLSKFEGRVFITRGYSPKISESFQGGSLDFVYLDGNHSLEAVAADLTAWWPKLKSGGLMAGHDFLDGHSHGCRFGVKTAVTVFAKRHGIAEIRVSEETWPQWSFDKP